MKDIKLLIVDDSETETALLKLIFESQPDMKVIGCAKNGNEAVKLTELLKPDLVTMDILMPEMDGYEATRQIMAQCPTPIVMISSKINNEILKATFQALEAGALSILEKPANFNSPDFAKARQYIIDTVRNMSEIKVIKRRFHVKNYNKKFISKTDLKYRGEYEVVAIGSSVGGPQVLKSILSKLPAQFPVPIVIVQHMAYGYIDGFAQWLNKNVELNIKNAENQELLKPGTVYFAPDNFHTAIDRVQGKLIIKLVKGNPISGFCPSATFLLQSVAKVCGKNAIGALLTGMGNDGAQGLLELKQNKGHTFTQDPESAVVFGMAGVAQSLGAVDKIVELDHIPEYLIKITHKM